ncbi:hypothetical protein [Parvibium lacunae]|uniref:Uncharacterized protein n=1 Tax=Parvibium lacunae TaxID=1888893 RepID=A0A368L648_9BURK|nr:hypothetical protein [Parvibium lacunae]RCS58630.1 hypothetical protein DU000_07470 [Parvibium lacunae]
MHYHQHDVIKVWERFPYETLGDAQKSLDYLDTVIQAGAAHRDTLAQYPTVRAEPLDEYYRLKLFQTIASNELLRDIAVTIDDWRGGLFMAWLVLLKPEPALLAHREAIAALLLPEHAWLKTWLHQAEQPTATEAQPHHSRLATIKAQLAAMPTPASLQLKPAVALDAEKLNALKQAYLQQGAAGFHSVLNQK